MLSVALPHLAFYNNTIQGVAALAPAEDLGLVSSTLVVAHGQPSVTQF